MQNEIIMKIKFWLISIAIISTVSVTSCKFFKDEPLYSNNIDTLIEQEPEVEIIVDTQEVIEEPAPAPTIINNRYFMIVGSFEIEKNAEVYAAKLSDQGYQAEIHYVSNGYYRVSAKGYEDFQLGVSEINMFRNQLTPNAWLYVKR